ncbi:MAG: alginate lyase family protein [Chromatiaceae bacterium]|nr:alginate lyase family protein [Chromatiaceae bacterium]
MIARYWHTLRYLLPVQFYGRLWFRLYRPTPDRRPAQAARPVPGGWVPPVAKPVSLLGPTTFRFLNETHALAGAGHEAAGGGDPWNDPARDKLWLYNLHYFDDLGAAPSPQPSPLAGEGWGEGVQVARDQRLHWHLALLQRWVAENPPGHGNGWEPYPTSLRIVNWIKWSLTFASERGGVPALLPPACLQSLAVQTRWLSQRLEHHLLGNHLFANAKALVYAGAFFVGPEADRWRGLGLRLMARELDEQILPDGGHFERSPMYHAILLEDVLDLINLAGAYPKLFGGTETVAVDVDGIDAVAGVDAVTRANAIGGATAVSHWRAKATAMLDWLAAMTHPDGAISFFNDAAFGIAPTLADLERYADGISAVSQPRLALSTIPATTPGMPAGTTDDAGPPVGTLLVNPAGKTDVPCRWLRDSGYVRLAVGPAVAILDVAPIGPDYLPGHAHADTLSFELSLFGQRVIVNGGTSRYGSGPERLAERGTAAHSTVQIDGADSSEVWGGFRVARRARVLGVKVRQGESDLAAVSDEGLPARPVMVPAAPAIAASGTLLQVSAAHDGYRRLAGRPVHHRTWDLTEDRCSVIDAIEGEYRTAIARFHLHPAIRVAMDPGGDGDQASGYLYLPGGQQVRWQSAGGPARLVPDAWHPQFGLSEAAHCLELRLASAECRLHLAWGRGDALHGDDQGPSR